MRKWLFAFLLLFSVSLAAEDIIYLEDGGIIRGKIKKITRTKVVIETDLGITQVIFRDSIQKIVRGFNPLEEYKRRLQRIEELDDPLPKDYLELAKFCEKYKELRKFAKDLYRQVIELDPNHPVARAKLGYIRYQGEWITQREYREKVLRGYVKVGDRWVPRSELEKAKRELERKEQERLRKWLEWKKQQEEERKKLLRRRASRPTAQGFKNKKIKVKGFVSFKKMFQDTTPDVPWEEAHIYESRYYRIKSNTKPAYIKVYAIMLDKFYEKFCQVFYWNKRLRRKLPVYIYANQQEFMARENKPRSVGGFFQWGFGGAKVVAYHGTFGTTGNTFTVLAHECTHQFEWLVLGATAMSRTPPWIIEGLAVFFESSYYDVARKKVIVGTIPYDRLRLVQMMIRRGNYIPIETLMKTPKHQFSAVHYAHAWAVIYWMIFTSKQNRRVFNQIWETCKKGGITFEQVKQIIKVDFKVWEEYWKKWILKLK